MFSNQLLTITGVILVAKELPLDDTLDICSIRGGIRTFKDTWKNLSKASAYSGVWFVSIWLGSICTE